MVMGLTISISYGAMGSPLPQPAGRRNMRSVIRSRSDREVFYCSRLVITTQVFPRGLTRSNGEVTIVQGKISAKASRR